MKKDNIIFDIIEKEHQRQLKGIELIASENFVSDQVMQAMGSCLTNISRQALLWRLRSSRPKRNHRHRTIETDLQCRMGQRTATFRCTG